VPIEAKNEHRGPKSDIWGHRWPNWSHMGKQRGPMASIGDIWGSTGFHGRGHPINLTSKNITKLLSKYQKSQYKVTQYAKQTFKICLFVYFSGFDFLTSPSEHTVVEGHCYNMKQPGLTTYFLSTNCTTHDLVKLRGKFNH
jgi:hypothetical protein